MYNDNALHVIVESANSLKIMRVNLQLLIDDAAREALIETHSQEVREVFLTVKDTLEYILDGHDLTIMFDEKLCPNDSEDG